MHRLILDAPEGALVDHQNRNGWDNRRCNIRLASAAGNCHNRWSGKSNTSGFKGVSRHSRDGIWKAQIQVNGKKIYLGLYSAPEAAARAYDEAAQKYYGDFAWLNFSERETDVNPTL